MCNQQPFVQRATVFERFACLLGIAVLLCCSTGCGLPVLADEKKQPDTQLEAAVLEVPRAHLVSVALPISGSVDTKTKQTIDQLIQDSAREGPRPILILEFRAEKGQAGDTSEFERSLSLARYLASDRLSGWRTIAFLPEGARGHAVLPVLACEEIIIDPDSELGDAGIHETHIDPTMRRGYEETAQRRRTVPAAIALGMLDRQLEVYRAQTLDGIVYVLSEDLESLQNSTTVSSFESIIPRDDYGKFGGRDLRLKFGFSSHLASDHEQLAVALKIPLSSLRDSKNEGQDWKPMGIDVKGPINAKTVNWVLRTTEDRLLASDTNLLFVRLNSPGGSAEDSIRLADYLTSLESRSIRTVVFVDRQARADASVIAIACDQIVSEPDARLGGPGASTIRQRDRPALQRAIRAIATAKQRDWSLPVALVDVSVEVSRFKEVGTGQKRYLCDDAFQELEEKGDWELEATIDTHEGLSGREAVGLNLAHALASDFDQLLRSYHLESDIQSIEPNWAHLLIESLASPHLAGVLLFIALFTLILEFSQPGLGVAGFASALCFVLYFWSQHLHGTAGWLEVLLFVVGVASILLEILVIPGLGVFGFGGGALVVASIVLASQTFVVPLNSYQIDQMPRSLGIVVAAGMGAFVSLIMVRRFLPNAPLVRRLLLAAPDEEQIEELGRRESLVDFEHLAGKRGRTTTQLTPSGKARFGDEVINVISEGDVIPVNADVMVTEIRGNRVRVQQIGF